MKMETQTQETQSRYGTVNFEKRKHPRFSVDLPVEYYKIGSPVKQNGRAVNASQGGLLLYFSEPLQIGQYLRLKLFFSLDSELNAVKALGEVVWSDNHLSKDWEYYPYGVKFIDISPEDRTKLRNFISRLSFHPKHESSDVDANNA